MAHLRINRNISAFVSVLVLTVLVKSSIAQFSPIAFPPDRTLVYKAVEGDDLELHVFSPRGRKPGARRPAIVFFFGGGWVGGTPAQFYPHSRYFALRGLVAISAQYRTRNSHGTDPFACIADGKSAIRWIRAHADQLSIDPDRIVAAGGSAGGHVAASTTLLQGLDEEGEDLSISSRPQVLMLFNPVIDTTEKGYGAEKLGSRQIEVSPVHHVRGGLPPAIVFHGTADTTVPFENVERFCLLMAKAGNRCTLVPYEGKAHGFFNRATDLDAYLDTTARADNFLKALGYLR